MAVKVPDDYTEADMECTAAQILRLVRDATADPEEAAVDMATALAAHMQDAPVETKIEILELLAQDMGIAIRIGSGMVN
jgi:hypothetical protein